MLKIILTVLCLIVPLQGFAAHEFLERDFQTRWCNLVGGELEYRLDDGTRVDCLTDEYAVEFDFAPKWAEGVGQALYYGIKTHRKPGIVLILEDDDTKKFVRRLQTVADKYKIKVWFVTVP